MADLYRLATDTAFYLIMSIGMYRIVHPDSTWREKILYGPIDLPKEMCKDIKNYLTKKLKHYTD